MMRIPESIFSRTLWKRTLLLSSLMMTLCASVAVAQHTAPVRPGKGQVIDTKMPCRLLSGISERPYTIYLPGSYNTDSLRRYPVLYLMHGGGGSHTDWQRMGRLGEQADSLVACGAMDEMVIVCPEGNEQNMMYFNAYRDDQGTPDWRFEDYFFDDLVPYIEQHYRVRSDKGGRAIAGFSMGGGAATVYGVHHPERFAMVYDISGYLRRQPLEFLRNDPSGEWRQRVIEANNPIRRINEGTDADVKAWRQVDWKVNVGDQDFTLEANMDLVKAMRQRGIPYAMHVSSGDHVWNYVAPALTDVLQRASRNFKALWIAHGDRHIYGVFHRPRQTSGKYPLVIISHGFNATHHFGEAYFEAFGEQGYGCYTFDFPCGSLRSRSDNNTMRMSVLDEVADLEAVVRFFQSQPDVDASRIVLLGESQGGLVSAVAASNLKKDISQLVLFYPAFCIPKDWNLRYPSDGAIPDTTRVWGVPLGRQFFIEARKYKPFDLIGKYKNPVLIVQGDKDDIVSLDDSRHAVKLYKKARLHVIPGAKHGFNAEQRAEAIGQVLDFLRRGE